MLEIDGKPVPIDSTPGRIGEPIVNIVLINGQWVLAPNLGKNLNPEYRVIPEKLLTGAALFEDKVTKKKVGYIDANKLSEYISKVEPPRGAGLDQLRKDLANAAKDIADTVKWSEYIEASQQRGIMREVTRRGQEFEQRYLTPTNPIPDQRYLPITEQGTPKRSAVQPRPTTAATSDITLSPSPIQGPGLGGRDVGVSIWSALNGLDFSTPGAVFDANDNPVFVLSQTTRDGKQKIYTVTEQDFVSSLANMTKDQVRQYQLSLKQAGQWNYEVNGELNYLNRATFNNALLAAAQGTTEANLLAYQQKTAPKNILEVVNEAARAAGGTSTTTETYIVNRESAQKVLDDVYLQSIGRKANKKEVDEFYQKVQKEAKARPTVRTDTGPAATTRQGFSGETVTEMAAAQAEARPEFLAYQLSTNFYDALLGAARLPINIPEAPTTGPIG